ncbi:MAG TPA: dual OB domain-containing protein [Candidatus Tripitaka californicus]|uniref:dual OB domain-containing protein n=1 Tax=Candidatus Tripitaka californicus TaxID=3367616 RepID=UPI004025572C|nr:hypothetical protein [Planctomycetota bacterium]
MAKIIILANSFRPGGYCMAGIDSQTGDWIRPVPRDGSRAIPKSVAEKIGLLDVVEIPLASEKPKDRYQGENRFVASWNWKIVGSVSPKKIIGYCEDSTMILHSHTDYVEPKYFTPLSIEQWKSLQLIRTNVDFSKDTYKPSHWRASFHDSSGHLLYLKVTDSIIVAKLNSDAKVGADCILTISLTGPWAPSDGSKPERCYKLVAGVIEL